MARIEMKPQVEIVFQLWFGFMVRFRRQPKTLQGIERAVNRELIKGLEDIRQSRLKTRLGVRHKVELSPIESAGKSLSGKRVIPI